MRNVDIPLIERTFVLVQDDNNTYPLPVWIVAPEDAGARPVLAEGRYIELREIRDAHMRMLDIEAKG